MKFPSTTVRTVCEESVGGIAAAKVCVPYRTVKRAEDKDNKLGSEGNLDFHHKEGVKPKFIGKNQISRANEDCRRSS
jgi:hypothetical protein